MPKRLSLSFIQGTIFFTCLALGQFGSKVLWSQRSFSTMLLSTSPAIGRNLMKILSLEITNTREAEIESPKKVEEHKVPSGCLPTANATWWGWSVFNHMSQREAHWKKLPSKGCKMGWKPKNWSFRRWVSFSKGVDSWGSQSSAICFPKSPQTLPHPPHFKCSNPFYWPARRKVNQDVINLLGPLDACTQRVLHLYQRQFSSHHPGT